jgi:hypothetical protein
MLLVVGGAVLVAKALNPPLQPGPLGQQLAYQDGIPARVGDVVTWGFALPANPTDVAITIRALEPVNPTRVQVLGVAVHDPVADGAVGQHLGPVPAGVHAVDPAGEVLPVGAAGYLEALVTVKVTGDDGSIAAVRLRYEQAGSEYADILPYSLTIVPPATSN